MITEDYVSFEAAKLLKEKGFNEPCSTYYFTKTKDLGYKNYPIDFNVLVGCISAPTQALVCRWLREKHLLNIDISIQNGGTWNYDIEDITCPFDGGIISKYWDDGFKTYEEALETGIQYCLKNLI